MFRLEACQLDENSDLTAVVMNTIKAREASSSFHGLFRQKEQLRIKRLGSFLDLDQAGQNGGWMMDPSSGPTSVVRPPRRPNTYPNH